MEGPYAALLTAARDAVAAKTQLEDNVYPKVKAQQREIDRLSADNARLAQQLAEARRALRCMGLELREKVSQVESIAEEIAQERDTALLQLDQQQLRATTLSSATQTDDSSSVNSSAVDSHETFLRWWSDDGVELLHEAYVAKTRMLNEELQMAALSTTRRHHATLLTQRQQWLDRAAGLVQSSLEARVALLVGAFGAVLHRAAAAYTTTYRQQVGAYIDAADQRVHGMFAETIQYLRLRASHLHGHLDQQHVAMVTICERRRNEATESATVAVQTAFPPPTEDTAAAPGERSVEPSQQRGPTGTDADVLRRQLAASRGREANLAHRCDQLLDALAQQLQEDQPKPQRAEARPNGVKEAEDLRSGRLPTVVSVAPLAARHPNPVIATKSEPLAATTTTTHCRGSSCRPTLCDDQPSLAYWWELDAADVEDVPLPPSNRR